MNVNPDKFRPLHDVVLIKLDEPDEKTEGGIVIPVRSREERDGLCYGVVAAIGPGKYEKGRLVPTSLKRGDRVCLRNRYGWRIPSLEDHVLATETELLGVVGD